MSKHRNYGITPQTLKEKVEMPATPAPEKVVIPQAPKAEKQVITKPKPTGAEAQLDLWMRGHSFPAGWQREIKTILKDVL